MCCADLEGGVVSLADLFLEKSLPFTHSHLKLADVRRFRGLHKPPSHYCCALYFQTKVNV